MRRIAASIASRKVFSGAVATAARWTSQQNPVNVEEFTLNDEIVKRHIEIAAKWKAMADDISNKRAAKDNKEILKVIEDGLRLFTEVGALDSPIQAEAMLYLEASQAHYNLGEYTESMEAATKALRSVEEEESKDLAKFHEIKEFIAFIELKQGHFKKAEDSFTEILQWIDVGSRTAMPMVSVAARNQRRTTIMGLGLSVAAQATVAEQTQNGDHRALYATALDKLVESLDEHIEAKDMQSVKETLMGALKCFVGLNDLPQAQQTCKKYISWCSRHGDEEGVAAGEAKLSEITPKE